jgi:uncharacterized protein YbjQ (UPF0145 family)
LRSRGLRRGELGRRRSLEPDERLRRQMTDPRSAALEIQVIIVTTENVTAHRTVRMLGQCFGVVVRSRGLGGNLMAGLRSIVGGEIHEYTQMLEEARRHALDRLVQNATAMGANAVLMMRFDSAEIGNTMSEIVAYGTAAVIEPMP